MINQFPKDLEGAFANAAPCHTASVLQSLPYSEETFLGTTPHDGGPASTKIPFARVGAWGSEK